jgi:Fe-S cluster biogenesis protein NfuA
MPAANDAQSQLKALESLILQIDQSNNPALTTTAKELVQLLMSFHGAAVERMLEIVHGSSASGDAVIEMLGQDGLVRSLLLLYGLHPDTLEARVLQALETTRPYLQSHGGNVDLVAVDDSGAVTLRLEGNCHGCPSSAATLKTAVEEAIYQAAPDVTAILVEGSIQEAAAPTASFVPVSQLTASGQGSVA